MNSVMKAWADMPPIFADRLMALLGHPGRVIRGLHHVNQLLLDADAAAQPHWLRPLRWAILYHDAIVEPLAPAGAEQQASAELWLEHCPAIIETVRGVSGAWEQDVADAIRATARPFARPDGLLPWQDALVDLDLGGLGLPAARYAADRLLETAAFEAAGIAPALRIGARRDHLEAALAAPRLYHRLHRDREVRARANVERELRSLEAI